MTVSTMFGILIMKADTDEEWDKMVELFAELAGHHVMVNADQQEVRINTGMISGA